MSHVGVDGCRAGCMWCKCRVRNGDECELGCMWFRFYMLGVDEDVYVICITFLV